MDDFEAFRLKKLGKAKPQGAARGGAPADDFEAFRRKKLDDKVKAKRGADSDASKQFRVEEEGKAKGLVSHRAKRKDLQGAEIPRVKGFDSHIARTNLPPESIEKFQGKSLWGDDLPKVDPDEVEKIDIVSHRSKAGKVDLDSVERPPGLKRY